MTDSTRQVDALLTEHLRYTPLSLIDDIINTVNAIIYGAIQAIENGLLSTPPPTLGFGTENTSSTNLSIPDTDGDGNIEYPEARIEIENGVHQLETLLEATVDKTFDKFEIYTLRNILTVPEDLVPWMRLGHYENLNLNLPPTAPTPDSIHHLRQTLQETRKLNLALRHESARNKALLGQLHTLLSPTPTNPTTQDTPDNATTTQSLSFLTKSHPPLTPHAQFHISQLPALRALLASLRPKLKTLPATAENVDWESRREERRQYIERRTRRVVQDGGLEEEEMVGTKMTGEEVASLERVVGALGGREGSDVVMEE